MFLKILFLSVVFQYVESLEKIAQGKMEVVYAWNQIKYDVYGVKYTHDSDYKKMSGPIYFKQELNDSEKYFIQYNNVPVGMAVHEKFTDVIISVPRRRFGIPATLSSVSGTKSESLFLTPLPEPPRFEDLVSVYRPAVDRCNRLWVVDTGLLEIPDARRQVQPPSIVIFDLDSNDGTTLLKYELKPSDLISNRTSGGLTSITVEVGDSCEDSYAYITDLATESLVVFSLKARDSWSFTHDSFKHDPASLNFTVAGIVIPWRDGLFSTALVDNKLYLHAMASTKEYSVTTDALKVKGNKNLNVKLEGDKGPNTQSGSHDFHRGTRTLFFASVAQDAILCWNVDKPLRPENVGVTAVDHDKLVYISDLRVVKDDVWVLVNQMPLFVFFALNPEEKNFYVHRGKVSDLIKGTPCEP